MKKILLLCLAFFLLSTNASPQEGSIYGLYRESGSPPEDFLVLAQMDPVSGSFSELDTIDQVYAYGLASSTFDQTNQYYIFKGLDNNNFMRLISRDVVENTTAFAPENNVTANDFQYDMNNQILYALGNYVVDSILIDTLNGGTYMYEFATRLMAVNVETGDAVELNQMPNLRAFPVGNSTFDSNNGRYIVSGFDSTYTTTIFEVDAQTGAILVETPVILSADEALNELEYNNEDNTLYGIYRQTTSGVMAIASVDMESGEITVMDEIADGFAFTPGASVFDQLNQQFIFYYINDANQTRLLVYDVSEEVEISNIPLEGYFTEIEVDNSAYATLKYGTTSVEEPLASNEALQVFPNPAVSEFSVFCEDKFSTIKVYDLTGKEVYKSTCELRNQELVASGDFDPGIYFVRVETANKVHTKKIVIE